MQVHITADELVDEMANDSTLLAGAPMTQVETPLDMSHCAAYVDVATLLWELQSVG